MRTSFQVWDTHTSMWTGWACLNTGIRSTIAHYEGFGKDGILWKSFMQEGHSNMWFRSIFTHCARSSQTKTGFLCNHRPPALNTQPTHPLAHDWGSRERERERERERREVSHFDKTELEHGEPRREGVTSCTHNISAHAAEIIDTSKCFISTYTVQHHLINGQKNSMLRWGLPWSMSAAHQTMNPK